MAALEWLDPVFIGGHWVPQMIELAGGEDLLGQPGEKSRTVEWAEVEARRPDVVVSMPCGSTPRRRPPRRCATASGSPRSARGSSRSTRRRTSRGPGPRLVEGVELLGHLLHPELVPAPPTRRSIELDLAA